MSKADHSEDEDEEEASKKKKKDLLMMVKHLKKEKTCRLTDTISRGQP